MELWLWVRHADIKRGRLNSIMCLVTSFLLNDRQLSLSGEGSCASSDSCSTFFHCVVCAQFSSTSLREASLLLYFVSSKGGQSVIWNLVYRPSCKPKSFWDMEFSIINGWGRHAVEATATDEFTHITMERLENPFFLSFFLFKVSLKSWSWRVQLSGFCYLLNHSNHSQA